MTKKIRFQTLNRGTGIPVAKRKPLVKTLDTSAVTDKKPVELSKESLDGLPEMDMPKPEPAKSFVPEMPRKPLSASGSTANTSPLASAQAAALVASSAVQQPEAFSAKASEPDRTHAPTELPRKHALQVYPQTWFEKSFWWLAALCLDFAFVGMSILSLVIVPKLLGMQSFGLFYEFSFWLAKINTWELLALGFAGFSLYWMTFKWLAGETLGSLLFVKTPRS